MSDRDDEGWVQDVFCAAVPEKLADAPREEVVRRFKLLAHASVVGQYQERRPRALEFETTDWMITSDPGDVEKFQPAHDCAACRAGNDQAVAFLRDHPGRRVAMANMTYREFW